MRRREAMAIEQSMVSKNDKENTDKKRRNHRLKPNSSSYSLVGADCSSANEIDGEGSECLGNGNKSNGLTSSTSYSSLKEDGVVINSLTQHESTISSNVALKSIHTLPFIDQSDTTEVRMLSKLSILSNKSEEIYESLPNKNNFHQLKDFSSHWSSEVTNEALEKKTAFRALFRVNGYNRLEAYCKIDGLPTDILISGLAAQNRAVEGDIVAVQIDPLSMWTWMKGSVGQSNNIVSIEEPSVIPIVKEILGEGLKGKTKVGAGFEYGHSQENILHEGSLIRDYHLSTDGLGKLCAKITSNPSKRPTGKIVSIIEKSPRRDTIVGFLEIKQWLHHKDYIRFTPNDSKFPKMMVPIRWLPDSIKKRLEIGDLSIAMEIVGSQLDNWGEGSPFPQARIIQLFGPGCEIEAHIGAILFENKISTSEFSPESVLCLPNLHWEVPNEQLKHREDLRNFCVFTIDPSTATDLDDALSITSLPNGIVRVGVHIADVSYFVLPDSALDVEAQIRSTSIYMLQHKIPMLPPLLSESAGSLIPGVDRLAFSMLWDINIDGNVVDRWIGRTVIRSCCKLSYEHAQDIIDGKIELDSDNNIKNDDFPQLHGQLKWVDIIRCVKTLDEIAKILKQKRFGDGALSLESSKVGFLFDEFGIVTDTKLSERKESNFLVEEFMLLANRTAAEIISKTFPDRALLRKHSKPEPKRLRELEALYRKHGLELNTATSAQFHQSLDRIKEQLKDDSQLLDILMLYATKHMRLASYFSTGELQGSESDWGHYALAVPLYTHFTSPLRRYPDIIVHRTLVAALEAEELYLKQKGILQKDSNRCFSGISFDQSAAESKEGKEALMAAALKYKIPCTKALADVADYCNERKLASRHVKDACNKLYTWVLLKNKKILLSEARVLGLGPRFMSVYIYKLGIERRIHYDEVEGLRAEYLDSTCTLLLSLHKTGKRFYKRSSTYKSIMLEHVALIISPCELKDPELISTSDSLETNYDPAFFPLTVKLFSTIMVALHAVDGNNGPLEVGVRLYMSSYVS